MKIYIEASSFYGKRSGVGRYGLSTFKSLAVLRKSDSITLFSFLRPGRHIMPDFEIPGNSKIKYIRLIPGRLFSICMRHGISLPIEILCRNNADVLLFPNFISWASITRKPRVAIIHDLAFVHFPEYIQSKNLRYLQKQLPKSIKRSKHIVAVSEATKRDLVSTYGLDPTKISVVYNAVDPTLFNKKAIKRKEKVTKELGLPEEYLLFVGNVEPRKNIATLLSSYASSYSSHKLPLIIVGSKGWNDSEIVHKLKQLNHLPIYLTSYINDKDLPTIYAGATALLFPSLYEGFGIPVLEAMSSGCPVVCSNVSSLPEVAGDAALLVDPLDPDALTTAIIKIVKDKELRLALIAAGYKQAEEFTWEKSAARLSEVLDKVVNYRNL